VFTKHGYGEACALIEARDAKLQGNETALNNDKLYLKEHVFELQQERQSRTESWKPRETEQKDREQPLAKRLKRSQQLRFRIREQQLNIGLSESKTATQQLKREL
jgi:hypothetical protein